jgi:hypothetical protein
MNFPSSFNRYGRWSDPAASNLNKKLCKVDETRAFLTNAKSYLADPGKDRNLIFESTKGLFDGTQTLFIHATNELQIVDAVNLAVERNQKNCNCRWI